MEEFISAMMDAIIYYGNPLCAYCARRSDEDEDEEAGFKPIAGAP